VLDQLARAQDELTAKGIDLLNVAHAIGRNAVATFKQELVNSLVQDDLLHDHQNGVDYDDPKIVAPANEAWDFAPPARRRHFPDRHGDENAEKEGHADQRFVRQQEVGHGMSAALPSPSGRITFNYYLE
jgi:hypothetical protein